MDDTCLEFPRSKLGMDIFLSHHKGFHGTIKSFPEDFRVAEVDLTGKLVRLQSGTDATPLPNVNSNSISSSMQDEEQKPGDDKDKIINLVNENLAHSSTLSAGNQQLTFDELIDFGNLTSALQKTIGLQVMNGLRTFSEQELDRFEPVDSSTTSSATSEDDDQALNASSVTVNQSLNSAIGKCFSLGEIPEKDERTFVHKAVQHLYPFLKTSAVSLLSSSSRSIQVSTNPVYWEFRKLLPIHQTESIVRFACSKFSNGTISVGSALSKEERTLLHRGISRHFGKFLESKTYERAGRQEVVLRFRERYSQGCGRGVKRKGVSRDEQESGPVYTGFTLKKENLETLDALHQLGRVLKMRPSDFSYAGIKDKKAVTLQSVAVKGVASKRFNQLINNSNLQGITIGNVQPLTSPIHIGDLTGNLFNILIRNIHIVDGDRQQEEGALLCQEIDSCFKCMKERGFVNYFGQQRFGKSGNGESQSAAIGQAILAGNFHTAIQLILGPDADKDDSVNNAKRHFQKTSNAKEALALMPKYKSRECLLLKALHRHGLDRDGCVRALYCIPHAMRQLYIHAFCSLVWNHMASERLRCFGYKVVVGDLVLMGEEKQGTRDKIQEVSEADVQNEIFSIQDVVLPLPGNSIRYPSNRVGEAYAEYMEEAGLGSCTYRVTELQLNIPGDYRRLIRRPEDLWWDLERMHSDSVPQDQECCVTRNTNAEFPSLQSDLSKRSWPTDNDTSDCKCLAINLKSSGNSPSRNESEVTELSESHQTSESMNLRVKFKLQSSTYATVFLRELMKR